MRSVSTTPRKRAASKAIELPRPPTPCAPDVIAEGLAGRKCAPLPRVPAAPTNVIFPESGTPAQAAPQRKSPTISVQEQPKPSLPEQLQPKLIEPIDKSVLLTHATKEQLEEIVKDNGRIKKMAASLEAFLGRPWETRAPTLVENKPLLLQIMREYVVAFGFVPLMSQLRNQGFSSLCFPIVKNGGPDGIASALGVPKLRVGAAGFTLPPTSQRQAQPAPAPPRPAKPRAEKSAARAKGPYIFSGEEIEFIKSERKRMDAGGYPDSAICRVLAKKLEKPEVQVARKIRHLISTGELPAKRARTGADSTSAPSAPGQASEQPDKPGSPGEVPAEKSMRKAGRPPIFSNEEIEIIKSERVRLAAEGYCGAAICRAIAKTLGKTEKQVLGKMYNLLHAGKSPPEAKPDGASGHNEAGPSASPTWEQMRAKLRRQRRAADLKESE